MTMDIYRLLLITAVVLPAISAINTEIHKHMSPDELRSVFHVEHHSLVPEYQLVQLKHHVNKRHVAAVNIAANSAFIENSKKSAHDKISNFDKKSKTLNKYSEYSLKHKHIKNNKRVIAASDNEIFTDDDRLTNVDNNNNNNSDNKSEFNKLDGVVSETVTLGPKKVSKNYDLSESDIRVNKRMEDTLTVDDKLEDGVHKIRFEAFGRPMVLKLKKTDGLFKKDGLKMWTVIGNDTQPHGVEFIETEDMGDESEHIGETYQDEDTQAALVIRRDPKAGLLVEGSIGHDLVIKPLPSTLSATSLIKTPVSKGIPPDQDDEMFMDPNQDDMVSIDTGLPIKRSKTAYRPVPKSLEIVGDGEDVPNTTEVEMNYDDYVPTGKNKMDNEEAIVYDDRRAKEERLKSLESSEEKAFDVRKALIEAFEGAKHVVYKRDVSKDMHDELSDYAFMEPDRLQKRWNRRKRSSDGAASEPIRKRSKREAPYVIYPEILVIVDYDGYRLHGGDNLQIKRYFVSFWNGVDLRYKLLKGPKIRISIAGIIIPRGRDATPYLERNRVGRDAIDSAAALTDMGKYLFREKRLPVYDIAVAVTKLDMCRRQYANDVCNRGTAGFAYVGGACVVNKRLEKVNSVAIIEDTGGFSGIIVAAHEVGHLLGAVHDGSPPPSYLGGPGAEKCRWEDGYIMSDLRHTDKGFRWSPCSVLSFHHFLNGDTATCLYNSPHEDESLPRVLPGKLLSLDAQCRKDRGTSACFKDERVCAQLFCFDAGSGYCVAYRPAAEGSPCGDGQYCINGRCVAEHENIIPDYSHHTPSYIRRETSPYFGNDTIHRFEEQTTQAYGTYPGNPYQQTYYNYPSTGQSPQSYAQPQYTYPSSPLNRQYQYTTQSPYQFQLPVTHHGFSYNPYFSTTRSPYDFRNFQVYQYTAETKQTHYTVPSTSQSSVSTDTTTSTTTTTTTTPTTTLSTSTTTRSPFFLRFSFSSTKNPYDFKDFATKRTYPKSKSTEISTSEMPSSVSTEPSTSSTSSTEKPRFGFFSKLDFRNYFNRTTTKNPYDFDLSNYREISNNNIKRSYSIGSYYGSQNHPVANIASPNGNVNASSYPTPIQKNSYSTIATEIKSSV